MWKKTCIVRRGEIKREVLWVISNNLWRPMLFKQGEIPVWQKELFPLCRFIKAANSFVLSVNTVSEGL